MLFSRKLLLQEQFKFDDQIWDTPGQHRVKLPAGRYTIKMVGAGGASGVAGTSGTFAGGVQYIGGIGGPGGTGRFGIFDLQLNKPTEVLIYVGTGGTPDNPEGALGRGGIGGVSQSARSGLAGNGGAAGEPCYITVLGDATQVGNLEAANFNAGVGTNFKEVAQNPSAWALGGGGGGGGGAGGTAYTRYDSGGPAGGGGGSIFLEYTDSNEITMVGVDGGKGGDGGATVYSGGRGADGSSVYTNKLLGSLDFTGYKGGDGSNGASGAAAEGGQGLGAGGGGGGGGGGNTGSAAGGAGGGGAPGAFAQGGHGVFVTVLGYNSQDGVPSAHVPESTVDPEGNLVEAATPARYGQGGMASNLAGGTGWVRITRRTTDKIYPVVDYSTPLEVTAPFATAKEYVNMPIGNYYIGVQNTNGGPLVEKNMTVPTATLWLLQFDVANREINITEEIAGSETLIAGSTGRKNEAAAGFIKIIQLADIEAEENYGSVTETATTQSDWGTITDAVTDSKDYGTILK